MEEHLSHQSKHGDYWRQYLIANVANMLSFIYGMTLGWTAPMQPLLEVSPDSTILMSVGHPGFHVTTKEMSWIGSLLSIGVIVGIPICGYLASAIGRKKTIVAATIPVVLAYTLNVIASSPKYLFAARVLAGIGAGAGSCVIIPMYVGEISEVKIRGILGSFHSLFVCGGTVAAMAIGTYTNYAVLQYVTLIGALICSVLSFALPESPVYSLLQNCPDEAFRSLTMLRGNHRELIQRQVSELSSMIKEISSGMMSLREMFNDPPTRRGVVIICILSTFQQSCGMTPVLNYTTTFFSTNSSISPSSATMIIGSLSFVGALLGTSLIDQVGRRMLLIFSCTGTTIALSSMAYFFYLVHIKAEELIESTSWLPITALSLYVVFYYIGLALLPYVLASEVFRAEARSKAVSIISIQVWIITFLIMKMFTNVSASFGTYTCLIFFASCAFGGGIFSFLYVIETRAKPLNNIIQEWGGGKV